MAIAIYNKASEQRLFEITRVQLDELIDALEEEDEGDHDYYIDAAACDFLEGKIDAAVLSHLREALGSAGKATEPPVGALAAGPEEELPEVEDEDESGIEIVWREEK
ncbi:MAG: hypothetical protein EXR72_25665 [Myxococcales bacterium]|nr:hypothetical protein [Myxococcales bacterium]